MRRFKFTQQLINLRRLPLDLFQPGPREADRIRMHLEPMRLDNSQREANERRTDWGIAAVEVLDATQAEDHSPSPFICISMGNWFLQTPLALLLLLHHGHALLIQGHRTDRDTYFCY